MKRRVYQILRSQPISLLPVPVAAPSTPRPLPTPRPEWHETPMGIFAGLFVLGLPLAFVAGLCTGAIWLVPAAEIATWEAAPGLWGAMGGKIIPEVAAAGVAAAL